MTSVRTVLLPASFQGAAVVGQTRIWCEPWTAKEQKRKAKIQTITSGGSSSRVNKSQNDLSHNKQARAINSPTGQQKWPCWVWEEASLARNTIFCLWVTQRAKADVWGSSATSSSKSGKFAKRIVMTLDFGSQFYLIFIVSQRPPKHKSWARDQIWNGCFPQTKLQHQSVLHGLLSSAKSFLTQQ